MWVYLSSELCRRTNPDHLTVHHRILLLTVASDYSHASLSKTQVFYRHRVLISLWWVMHVLSCVGSLNFSFFFSFSVPPFSGLAELIKTNKKTPSNKQKPHQRKATPKPPQPLPPKKTQPTKQNSPLQNKN